MPSKSKHEPKGASRSRDQAKREETVEEEYDLVNDGPKKEDVNAAVLRGWPPNRSEIFESRSLPLIDVVHVFADLVCLL